MALKAQIAKLEDVAEAFRGEYKANADGTYRLDTEGVEDVSGLKGAAQKERDAAETAQKALKDFQKKFEGVDPVEARKMMQMIATNAEMKLIAEGKIDEVIERRTNALKADYEGKLTAAQKDGEQARAANAGLQNRLIGSALREAAVVAGVHSYAVEDVLLLGTPQWSLDDNHNVVMKKNDAVVMGKDGKTPLTPKEWVEQLKETRPHYFPASGGGSGGSQGGGSGDGGKNQMKRSALELLSHVDRAAFFKGGGTVID